MKGAITSQYPRDASETNHVEYILVASFDIDRGSVMQHQYPAAVGGDEHMLAELMLPDQTHMRSQDWTIFFLHKDAALEEDNEHKEQNGDERAGAEQPDEPNGETKEAAAQAADAFDGPPLIYVLNLVNTKQDQTVKRGAVVKAMAICTRHSFLHIYKPLLLLALEQYFANPAIETLANLYNAVNSMDLSLMPRLSHYERFILQSSDAKDMFIEKFEALIAQRVESNNEQDPALPSPNTQHPLRSRYGLPRDTHEFESVVKYANIPVPIKVPTALSPETVGDFSLIKLVTTFSTPHTTSPSPFSPTHPHLTTAGTLTHPIIVLLNALLTQKRIIFLGHNLPSSEVAEAVLAACSLVSGGILRGFTRHAFPYTDLTKIDDLLKVPGFIAGVTNPAFGHKTEWWDLLCDLSTGRMRISNRVQQASPTEGVLFFQQPSHMPTSQAGPTSGISAIAAADATGDGAFMGSVLKAIEERHGENAIRSRFRRWVLKFTRLAAAFEELVYGASVLHIAPSPQKSEADGAREVLGHGYVWPSNQAKTNELAANATRIEGWRNTRSYYNFIQDIAAFYAYQPVKAIDLQHQHDRLANLRLGPALAADIYLAICAAVQSGDEINQLLAVVINTSSDHRRGGTGFAGQGQGLFFLAYGLFHPNVDVRMQVAELLARIREHEAGRHFWDDMGMFMKLACEKVLSAAQAKKFDDEEDEEK
ncbi:hypothetical protein BAUCODRAFT_112001 [Baudoinia panamericana UAMH 10762]|uniref:UDENN domain-containing protein n=1 Tax=Baudoinia panamericana (strain UAMH 10762) TaxID=717646 RepID=M2N7Q0_BAUPA|nr:uncharacterized protein BAUCODRAFT_112001 [Baudoinia panamericana UAMH 10762]EMC94830.1 hypothetical protein BAUCODRAFT_112001 [Baudoinia panamericana UAMH 10762]